MSYEEGEVIELHDDGGGRYDDEIYVKGHVSDEEATEAYQTWWNETIDEEGEEPPALGPWRHAYARWSTEHWEGEGMVLRAYSGPGRGRFKVTVAESQWQIDKRAERKRREDEGRAAFLERYPGTNISHVEAWRENHPVRVWFDVPGTQGGAIHWRSDDPEHVSIRTTDLVHWHAYKGGR